MCACGHNRNLAATCCVPCRMLGRNKSPGGLCRCARNRKGNRRTISASADMTGFRNDDAGVIQCGPGIREMDLALRAAADTERAAGDAPLVALRLGALIYTYKNDQDFDCLVRPVLPIVEYRNHVREGPKERGRPARSPVSRGNAGRGGFAEVQASKRCTCIAPSGTGGYRVRGIRCGLHSARTFFTGRSG
jgi:hypothetical protein